MSDFEGRVAEVLRSEAVGAPDALGLADAARGRARARRRTRVAVVGAAAVAAVAVPVTVVALGGDDGPGKTPVAENTSVTDPAPAGRWESWHGVTVQVPEDWAYGNQSTWCASGGTADQFLITRPEGASEAVACTPTSSYGLSFQDIDMKDSDEPFDWPVVTQTGEAWPPHTFVGAHGENGVLVTVAGPDRDQLLEILATMHTVDAVDPNGCSVEDDGGPGMAGSGQVPVCRYDEKERLVQSELLTGDDAVAAAEAVRATPQEGGGNLCDNGETEYVVLGVEGDRVEVQFAGNSVCVDRGVFVEGVRHEITEDVLYWALSPGWSGAVPEGTPFPAELR